MVAHRSTTSTGYTHPYFHDPFTAIFTAVPINVERGPDRQDGKGRIRLTVFVGGVLKRKPLEIHVKASCWDTVHKRVKIGDTMHAVYNAAIEKALERARTLEVEHPEWSAVELIAAMGKKPSAGRSFYEVARERLDALGSKFGYNTKRQKLSALKLMEELAPGVTVEGLDHATIERVQMAWMKDRSDNTVTYKLKRIEAMWNDAVEHFGLEVRSPFRRIEKKLTPTVKRGLFPDQMDRLIAVDLSEMPPIVQLARDAFVLQYFLCGMRWGDMCRAHTGWFHGNMLTYQMHKTDTIIQWEVNPRAREIMDRWGGEPFGNERYILPLLKANMDPDAEATYRRIDQKGSEINKALRIVSALAKVPRVTTHKARHTNSVKAKLSGVDNKALQELNGHKHSKTTDIYTSGLMGTMHSDAYKKMHG